MSKSTKPRVCHNRLTVDGPLNEIPLVFESIKTLPGDESHYGESGGLFDFHRLIPVEVPTEVLDQLQIPESQKMSKWNPLNWINIEQFVDPLLAYQSDSWGTNNAFHTKKIDDNSIFFDTLRLPPIVIIKKLAQNFPQMKFLLEFKYPNPDQTAANPNDSNSATKPIAIPKLGKFIIHIDGNINERIDYNEKDIKRREKLKEGKNIKLGEEIEMLLDRLKRLDQVDDEEEEKQTKNSDKLSLSNIDPNAVTYDDNGQLVWKNKKSSSQQKEKTKPTNEAGNAENDTLKQSKGGDAAAAGSAASAPQEVQEPVQIPLFESDGKCIIS